MPEIDIDQIIKLVEQQQPLRQDVVSALRNCKGGSWDGSGYFRFGNDRNANQPGATWQHQESLVIEQESKGEIVIDLLSDGRIGGIEFIDFIDQ